MQKMKDATYSSTLVSFRHRKNKNNTGGVRGDDSSRGKQYKKCLTKEEGPTVKAYPDNSFLWIREGFRGHQAGRHAGRRTLTPPNPLKETQEGKTSVEP